MTDQDFHGFVSRTGAARLAESGIMDWVATWSGHHFKELDEASSSDWIEVATRPAEDADERISTRALWTSLSDLSLYERWSPIQATSSQSCAPAEAAPSVFDANQNGCDPINAITSDDALAILDRQARIRLEMSGGEFLDRLHSGKFRDEADPDKRSNIAFLRMLASAIGR